MKNTLLILAMFCCFPVILFSQELNIGLESGMGSYKMNDLKEINTLNLNSLPFEAKNVANFPSYFYYKPSLSFSFKRFLTFGASLSIQSTGSRVSYADYSGEYSFDIVISSSSPSLFVELFYPVSKFRIVFGNEAGIEHSKLSLNEQLRIGVKTDKTADSFKSKNFYYEPSLKVYYPLLFMKIGLVAGYLIDLQKSDISSDKNKNLILTIPPDRHAQSDWSGVRLGISVTFNVLRISNKNRLPISDRVKSLS
jgi:hypothetical protein